MLELKELKVVLVILHQVLQDRQDLQDLVVIKDPLHQQVLRDLKVQPHPQDQ
jgi:hypothetical protein